MKSDCQLPTPAVSTTHAFDPSVLSSSFIIATRRYPFRILYYHRPYRRISKTLSSTFSIAHARFQTG
ncbi:hypothetical protein CGGC5_v002733 [Colletotrichum fructicola Nara gc5]|uniref:Uncharacterized protein n=1 Tax=Colletotrichum fructicola (strain Nara gc5) TaxID=1213859 RepID=A0A7J6JEL0_COLFN|nr:hypothetical protein CGGC5_v002733 [Colletotrichum fructicola Nara gc5]